MLLVVMLADRLDGHLLIIAVGDGVLDVKVRDVLPAALLDVRQNTPDSLP